MNWLNKNDFHTSNNVLVNHKLLTVNLGEVDLHVNNDDIGLSKVKRRKNRPPFRVAGLGERTSPP